MRPLEFLRSTTFRWALVLSGLFSLCTALTFAFIWQTALKIVDDVDAEMVEQAALLAAIPQQQRVQAIIARAKDEREEKIAALFHADGTRIAGNLQSLPAGLELPSAPQNWPVRLANGPADGKPIPARVLARSIGNEILVLGRKSDEREHVIQVIEGSIAFGLVPALVVSLIAGALLTLRAQKGVQEVNKRVQRIIAGDLRERLPTTGLPDEFKQLSLILNGLLDEMENLIHSLAGVGNDIAHDLRTPLTRVRVGLERAHESSKTPEELRAAIEKALLGLDQSLAMVTALLRIAEIEHSRRQAGFSDISLGNVVQEVADLYEPIAEDKQVVFSVSAPRDILVRGDRDLLFEAVANLVDNAVKYTLPGSSVELSLLHHDGDAVIRVRDSGPGISPGERDLVTRRFYRSDKSRSKPGIGLGLSLVAAVAKLHGFHFEISAGPGCVTKLVVPKASVLKL